jgi:hypothetical protein
MPRKPRFRNVGSGKGIKERLDEMTLRRLYLEEKLTQAQIASRYGCTPQFVSLLLRDHGIHRSSRSKKDQ